MARKTMFCIDEEVYDEFDVDEDSRERIEKARKWDLEFLTGQLNEEEIRSGRAYSVEQVYPLRNIYGRVDFELAKTLEIEFRKFVALTILNPGTPHAPPGAVDMYWHFFILHTEEYYEFCEEVWKLRQPARIPPSLPRDGRNARGTDASLRTYPGTVR